MEEEKDDDILYGNLRFIGTDSWGELEELELFVPFTKEITYSMKCKENSVMGTVHWMFDLKEFDTNEIEELFNNEMLNSKIGNMVFTVVDEKNKPIRTLMFTNMMITGFMCPDCVILTTNSVRGVI